LCQTTFGEMAIKIGAQKYLTKFYGLLGFKETGEDYIEDGIPHCIMIRDI
jgi:ElaA protein